MNEDDKMICALVRWLARKAVKAEWKAMGRKPEYADAAATNVYFMEHREELVREARAHPVALNREKGRRVNSIAPEELNRLIESYVKEHPWENVVKEFGCY
jgi:hypothetical protein